MKMFNVSLFDLDTTLYKGESGYVIIDLANEVADQRSDRDAITGQLRELRQLYKEKDITRRINRTAFAIGVIKVLYGRCFARPYDQKRWRNL
jgi:FMN phosphatase YigB (HAD superfamily)